MPHSIWSCEQLCTIDAYARPAQTRLATVTGYFIAHIQMPAIT